MYTEERETKSFKSVFIKIVLIVLFLFVLMILFPTKGFVTNYVDKKMGADSSFNSNLIAMATAGSGYYNTSRLPKNTGDKEKMTLEEMLKNKMIVKFTDKNGVACSAKKSYVEVTKEESEYTMKVNLSCEEKTDYIVLHMGLDGTQFPSTSTARCKFVKNLDESWSYGEWSSWSTTKIEEDGTNQVQTSTKTVQSGTRNETRNEVESAPATRYVFNGKNTYYVCAKKYDNAGTYNTPVTCTKNITVYTTVPNYVTVTYYRSRTKTLVEGSNDVKEANCDDESLINEGYTKVN